MRLANVVGTRPQLIKAAALQPALRERHDEVFVDTGQHLDERMAGVFFAELGLRAPDRSLGIGGGSSAEQTGRMLVALEGTLREIGPDAVVVYGDTNSTLAAALVAAKMDVPLAHVEAGLRSFDRRMPEEVNRLITDHLARWAFAPTEVAVANLAEEGIIDGVHLVGDVMRDLAARTIDTIRDPGSLDAIANEAGVDLKPGSFLFATVHRAENRSPDAIRGWARVLEAVARPDRPVVLAVHPGTRAAADALGIAFSSNVVVIEPLGYRSSLAIQLHAAAVLTDSGGIQREASWLGTPCVILRDTTEWVETVDSDGASSVLVGLDAARARDAIDRLAPTDRAADDAVRRARTRTIETDGAAASIARLIA